MRTEWAGERGKLKQPSTCDVSAPRAGGTRIHRIVHICSVALVGLVAVALCSVAACTQRTDGHASPAASAFPDLSRYPLVEGDHHTEVTQQYFSGSTFSTLDGQSCSTNARDYAHRLWCYGPRPYKGGYWDTSFGPDDAASIKPADPPSPGGKANPHDFLPLPAGHRIALGNGMECAVNDNGLFACHAGNHGFVFTPTSTRLF
ncbi:MAG: hypothetical protein QOE30_454 [Mycobacterium sp.]|nr:hypothetical protein [Mycobacterium sp.]